MVRNKMLPYRDLFYSPEYEKFIRDYYRAKIYKLGALYTCGLEDNNGLSITTFPKTYVVPNSLMPDFTKETAKIIKEQNPDKIYFRALNLSDDRIIPDKFNKTEIVSSILFIEDKPVDDKRVMTMFSKKTRNQVKKAIKSGLKIKLNVPIEILYPLYNQTIIRLKNNPKELAYLQCLKKNLGENLITVASYHNNKLCGGNIAYVNNQYLFLMYNFSDQEFWPMCVNDFLYFQTITRGLQIGVRIFDFGPAHISDISHRHFKQGFGTREYPLYEYLWYKNPIKNIRPYIFSQIRKYGRS